MRRRRRPRPGRPWSVTREWRHASLMVWRHGFWVRVFGRGVLVRRLGQMGLLYSERDGRWPGLVVVCGLVVKPLRKEPGL